MFSISFGSIFSSMVAVMLLSFYGFFFITQIRHSVYRDMRLLILLLFIAGIRLLVPFNLPINITIPSEHLLIPLQDVAFCRIPGSGLFLFELVYIFIFSISLILLLTKGLKYLIFRKHVTFFTFRNTALDDSLSSRTGTNKSRTVKALYTDSQVSPFVYGILNPVIVIPYNVYSQSELQYVLDHEMTHINQKDLFYKAAFNTLTALFWWNPFIWIIRQQADNAIEISNDISLYSRMSEQEKTDYASLLVKTAKLSEQKNSHYSLSLSSHNDPLIKRRVEDILTSPPTSQSHMLYIVHILIMVLIITTSFIVTPEPYNIDNDQIGNTFDLEDDMGAAEDNTYIINAGNHYELYIAGEMIGEMDEIPDDFKDYPVYTEKPDADKNANDKNEDDKSD